MPVVNRVLRYKYLKTKDYCLRWSSYDRPRFMIVRIVAVSICTVANSVVNRVEGYEHLKIKY